jgi:hypothetical protein
MKAGEVGLMCGLNTRVYLGLGKGITMREGAGGLMYGLNTKVVAIKISPH